MSASHAQHACACTTFAPFFLFIQVKISTMDKTKYVADWTTKHSLSSQQDAASQASRKLPDSLGSYNFVVDNFDTMNVSERVHSNSELNIKSQAKPSDSQKKTRSSSIMAQQFAQNNLSRQQPIYSNNNSSGSAPNSAKSGLSESSGYHTKQDVGRWSTWRKPGTSSSLSKAPNRSNSSLTSHEAEFQTWKKSKEYEHTNSKSR